MGMRSGEITDKRITATSSRTGNQPYNARPDDVGWCADSNDFSPYIQVCTILTIA